MAEEKTRPLSRERLKELFKFCGVNLFVIGVVISCRSQAQSDTFFQDAEVQYYFELFLFGFEILFNVALTFAYWITHQCSISYLHFSSYSVMDS